VSSSICTAYGLGAQSHAVAATQDVRFTAWGFGLEGLSATAYVRGRRQLDGAYAWPRADDAIDALLGYVQWNRPGLRIRLGRQETLSRLGFASFDGASLLGAWGARLRVEAFGGRSLARGLREPRNEALRGLEDWVPENEAFIVGATATVSPRAGTSLSVRLQRESWSDGSTLLSERGSVEVRSALGRVRLAATGDWDFGLDQAGKAEVSVQTPLTEWLNAEVRARRYVPYFDLSTIWGFFEPVGYSEVGVRAGLGSPTSALTGWASVGRREYRDASVVTVLSPLEDAGWSVDSGVLWRMAARWTLRSAYRLEWGAGAYLQSGDLDLGWQPSEVLEVRAHGSVYQQLEEFRLGDRRMAGGGVSGSFALRPRTRLEAGWLHHAVLGGTDPAVPIGPQTRGWFSISLPLGRDPGGAQP